MNSHYGIYGGQYVAETLMPTLHALEEEYLRARQDPAFQRELSELLTDYVGRESPLYFAKRLTEYAGGARIYLKREDLNHTGAHKINNTIGQALLARRMGKKRLIAETGAGMHGVATATVAALFGMECDVFMGAEDVRRQAQNAARMKMLGANLISVELKHGTATLKDAMNEALRDWVATVGDTFYVIGTVAGPHPYPAIVRDFQSVIGVESRRQILEKAGRLPDEVIACVGGGSNAIGMFADFIEETRVGLIGVEPAGHGIESGEHGAPLKHGRVGIYFGMKSPMMQTADGQIEESYSISAGLDFPSVGPQHAFLNSTGRADYVSITDDEALEAFKALSRHEGIIPALESSHALAHALKMMRENPEKEQLLVVNLSGRGDKDIFTVHDILKARGEI